MTDTKTKIVKRDCGGCYFDNDGDCANVKWLRAIDFKEQVEDDNGCLFFLPKSSANSNRKTLQI